MKKMILSKTAATIGLLMTSSIAFAVPTNNQVLVQAYLKKGSTAIDCGTGSVVINNLRLRVGGTLVGTAVSAVNTNVVNGVFSYALTVTPASLAAGTGAVDALVNVTYPATGCTPSTANGTTDSFTTNVYSVPLSLYAGQSGVAATATLAVGVDASTSVTGLDNSTANTLMYVPGSSTALPSNFTIPSASITALPAISGASLTNIAGGNITANTVPVTAIATASKTNSSVGSGDAGKIALLNSSGVIDGTMFPATLPAVNGSALTNVVASSVAALSVTTGSIATASKANTSAGSGDAGKIVLLDSNGRVDNTMISGLSVAQGGTGAATHTSGSLLVGAGTSAVTSLAAGATGNVPYATGAAAWSSGTPDTAGLVAKTGAQTITGVKSFTSGVILSASSPGNDNLGYFETVATCTPVPRGATTAGTPTTSIAVCRYTRIGRLVNVSINLTWSALTGSAGNMAIGGLPYSSLNLANFVQACSITVNNMTSPANSTVSASIDPNESIIRLYSQVVATNVQAALAVDTAASAQVSCAYMTN